MGYDSKTRYEAISAIRDGLMANDLPLSLALVSLVCPLATCHLAHVLRAPFPPLRRPHRFEPKIAAFPEFRGKDCPKRNDFQPFRSSSSAISDTNAAINALGASFNGLAATSMPRNSRKAAGMAPSPAQQKTGPSSKGPFSVAGIVAFTLYVGGAFYGVVFCQRGSVFG